MADLAGSYLSGVRSGESLTSDLISGGVDSYQKARAYRDKLKEVAYQHDQAAEQARTAASHYADKLKLEQEDRADKQNKEADEEADEQARQIETKRHNITTENEYKPGGGRGSANRASPALIALRDQYKQISGDVRSKTLMGIQPPPDMVKRYNAIGKALNAQTKHEDPSSVDVDFVPIPETPAASDHPAKSWMNTLSLGLLDKPTAAPIVGAEDWKQFDR
jgi:hypothetical protein